MPIAEKLISAERHLLDYAQHLEFHKRGRIAYCVHFSSLRPDLLTASRFNDAVRKIEQLVRRYHGEYFKLRNNDVVLALKDPDRVLTEDVFDQICGIFERDPLVRTARDSFISRYDLRTAYDEFLSFVKVLKHRLEREGASSSSRPREADSNDPGLVETVLGYRQPGAFVQKSTIYSVHPGMRLESVVHEMAFTLSALEEMMLEGAIIETNPEILRRGQCLMERRMLAAIPNMSDPWPMPWALSVGVDTLVSAEMIQFHRAWDRKWGRSAEIRPWIFLSADSIRDRAAQFEFARDYIKECNFRLVLTGLPVSQTLSGTARSLGLDMIRTELPSATDTGEPIDHRRTLERLFRSVDRESLIVGGCDHVDLLRQVIKAGAFYVQGPAADAVYSGATSLAA